MENPNRVHSEEKIQQAEEQLNILLAQFSNLAILHKSRTSLKTNNSPVAEFDEKLRPYFLSTYIEWAIASSVDHLQTVANLYSQGTIPRTAIFTLIRASIEHSSTAIWILASDDSAEVQRRVLIQGAREAILQSHLYETIDVQPKQDLNQKIVRIEKLYSDLGLGTLPISTARKGQIKQFVEEAGVILSESSTERPTINIVLAIWQATSGVAHGNSSAALGILSRRVVQSDKENGSFILDMDTTAVELVQVFYPTYRLLEIAMQKYEIVLGTIKAD